MILLKNNLKISSDRLLLTVNHLKADRLGYI